MDDVDILVPRGSNGLGKDFMEKVRASKAKYIIRFDADEQVDAKLAYSLLHELSRSPKKYNAIYPTYLLMRQYPERTNFKVVSNVQGAGVLYDRQSFVDAGGYNEDMDLQADLDFYLRYRQHNEYLHSDQQSYVWWPGRSKEYTTQIQQARKSILESNGFNDGDVHHFGAYHYI